MSENERIEQIKARLNNATPGEWAIVAGGSVGKEYDGESFVNIPGNGSFVCQNPDDADLICSAPADLRWLLEERERLEKEKAELREAIRFSAIKASNARGMAFHALEGKPHCGIAKESLALWLNSIADDLDKYHTLARKDTTP